METMSAMKLYSITAEEKIRHVTMLIRENFTSDISREGLACAVELSPDRLSRLFNQIIGTRFDTFVNNLRIAEAARRLADTDESITRIAMDVGFNSIRNFNRLFLKIHGMRPTEYRRCISADR